MKLLLEFPTSALLSSSQFTRRLMAACLSEEDRCFIALRLKTILGGPKHPDFGCRPRNEDDLPHTRMDLAALSPVSGRHLWVRHSWAPRALSRGPDVAPYGGCAKVTALGFVGEVSAIGFFPVMSNLSCLKRKNCSELQPRQNRGRKYFKDFLLYNILRYWGLLSCGPGVLCVSQ